MDLERAFERRSWLLPLVLGILTVIFLRPVVIPPEAGEVLKGNDYQALFYPLHQYIRQTLQSGELPLWNPHQFIGHPIIGNPHAALFYPATWFMWLVGVERGMGLSLVVHAFLGAWGMARLARSFNATWIGSLLAGVIYGMSGWTGARLYVGHYNLFVVYGLIPWMMVAYRHALARGTWQSTLPGMAVTGAALLAGYPPLVLFAGLALVTLWLYHLAQAYALPDTQIADLLRAGWYAGRLLLLIVVGGIVLGAALVIPTLQLTGLSVRSQTDLSFANSYALPPAQYIDLVLPGFFGSPNGKPFYWGAEFFEEYTAYVGLLPLLAIPLVLRLRRPENWYFAGLVAFGLALSAGIEGALLPLLVWWVPGYSSFRVPARGLMFVVIGAAGLTALLVSALQCSTPDVRRRLLRPALRVWLPVGVVIALIGAVALAAWYAASIGNADQSQRLFTASGSVAAAGLILLGVWLVLWLWTDRDPKSARFALLATVALVTLDAWHVSMPLITVTHVPELPRWAGARINVPLGPDSRVLAPGHFDNIASVTGHLDVVGYDPLPISSYILLSEASDPGDPTALINTLVGVKYLMVTQPYNKPNFDLIGIAEGGIYYRRNDPFPRAWFAKSFSVELDDATVRQKIAQGKEANLTMAYLDRPLDCTTSDAGTASITEYRPNDISIKTAGPGGLMILTDQYYPGWQAQIDGQPAPIYRADTAFRAVCVPPGDHTVQFEFRPAALYIGMAISALGWLAVIIASIAALFRPRNMKNA